jgi:PAS domain S-box-containing protein
MKRNDGENDSPHGSGRRTPIQARHGRKNKLDESTCRSLLENIRDGLYMLDRDGRFTFVNDVIVGRSGYPREWFLGRSYLDVIRPEGREVVERNFAAIIRGETVPPYQLAIPPHRERKCGWR